MSDRIFLSTLALKPKLIHEIYQKLKLNNEGKEMQSESSEIEIKELYKQKH
jgi:hypothetical protein